MRNRLYLLLALAVILTMLGSVGCGILGGTGSSDTGPIKIGYVGALSSAYGASNKATLEISVDELNQEGGINGRKVELIIEDSKAQIPLAVAAYQKLVMTDKCLLVYTEGTDPTIATREEAIKLQKEYPHIQFGIWSALDDLTDAVRAEPDKYKFFFRPYTKTGAIMAPVADVLKNTIGAKKVAVIVEDMAWAGPYFNGTKDGKPPIKEYLTQQGLEVVYYTKISASEKMFLPVFEAIAASGADTMYWGAGYIDAVTLAKQWADSAAKDIDLVSQGGASGYASFLDSTGGGGLGVAVLWPEVKVPFTAKTVPFFEKLNGKGVGLIASTPAAYDGPFILKAAVEKAGGTKDVNAIIKAVESMEVQRGFWKWKFDKAHDPIYELPNMPVYFGQHQGPNKFVAIGPEDVRKMANPNDKFIRVKNLRATVKK